MPFLQFRYKMIWSLRSPKSNVRQNHFRSASLYF